MQTNVPDSKKEGIEFCCGKSEMIRTGVFDDTGHCINDACAYGSC